MDGRDRRQFPRLEGRFEVDLLNMGDDPAVSIAEAVVPAEALDISKHGIRLRCKYNVPVGSLVSVIAYYKGQGSICMCDVVWKRGDGEDCLYGLFVQSWGKLDPLLEVKLNEMEALEAEAKATTAPAASASLSVSPS